MSVPGPKGASFTGKRLSLAPPVEAHVPGTERLPQGRTLLRDLLSGAEAIRAGAFSGRHIPMSRQELDARGWKEVDVVIVTGDAYIDHPSFAMAILGRVLEASGFTVAILSQPDWKSAEPWRALGRPRLFYAVSAGNMDSMINHYTASKRPRGDDAYSPGGRTGLRPDRASGVYSQRCREAFPGVPVILGGVEASLRRVAHYDYWSDTVRPSILVQSKADLVVHGMGERPVHEIAVRLARGDAVKDLRDMRGVAYLQGASEAPPEGAVELPSFEAVAPPEGTPQGAIRPEECSLEKRRKDMVEFANATRKVHHETNPFNAKKLIQKHGLRWVVINPPAHPLTQAEMDAVYDLPYLRKPHPSYQEPIPADAMIRDSVTIMRGCFGGCTFCSITAHQGRVIQSRSQESILKEITAMGADPAFKGTVSDIGGPTANMYQMRCTRPEVEAKCHRLSCVHPTICKLLGADHGPVLELMRASRAVPGVARVNVASGIRMDLARRDPRYVRELAAHHVGGHLKVAPEHVDPFTLDLMKKPGPADFDAFAVEFAKASEQAGKPKQFLVPYYISSHPGSTAKAMIELAIYLKQNGYKPRQVQDFIPAPMDIATCMYYTGLDPVNMKEVPVVRAVRERKVQRALMQFFKPENYFEVREALLAAGRRDLIGSGCDALIPGEPPPEALEARRAAAQKSAQRAMAKAAGTRAAHAGAVFSGEADQDEEGASGGEGAFVHAKGLSPRTNEALRTPHGGPKPQAGYRPHRKSKK